MASESVLADLGLDETLQNLAIALAGLNNALSLAKDPATGRLRVFQDGAVGTVQNVVVNSGAISTSTASVMGALGNATGPLSANVNAAPPAWAALQAPADTLRTRITVT